MKKKSIPFKGRASNLDKSSSSLKPSHTESSESDSSLSDDLENTEQVEKDTDWCQEEVEVPSDDEDMETINDPRRKIQYVYFLFFKSIYNNIINTKMQDLINVSNQKAI